MKRGRTTEMVVFFVGQRSGTTKEEDHFLYCLKEWNGVLMPVHSKALGGDWQITKKSLQESMTTTNKKQPCPVELDGVVCLMASDYNHDAKECVGDICGTYENPYTTIENPERETNEN